MTYTPFAIANKGKVRPLAVAMETRHPLLPDVPTFKELGVDWVDGAFRGIGVPKATPPEARQRLSELFAALNADPEMKELAAKGGFELVNVGVDGMDAFMRDADAHLHRSRQAHGARARSRASSIRDPSPQRDAASLASRWTNGASTSALTSDTASQSIPEPRRVRDIEAAYGAQCRRRMRRLGSDEDIDRVQPIAVDQRGDPLLVEHIKPASGQREPLAAKSCTGGE